MSDKPIIFSGPMVRALLDGTKTQTRRVLRPQLGDIESAFEFVPGEWRFLDKQGCRCHQIMRLPYAIGDRLWVREAFWTCDDCGYRNMCEGGANHSGHIGRWCCASCDELLPRAKTSPIFMPRWASRLTLTVTDVRVERLQKISRGDAIAEGIQRVGGRNLRWEKWSGAEVQSGLSPEAAYALLWNSINGPGAWDANPWVAAYTFTVQRGNIDQLDAVQ